MIHLEINDYVKLLEKANKSPLLNANFTFITKEQYLTLKQDPSYEKIVNLQPLDIDEILQLKQLNLISNALTVGDYYKMYRIGDWLSLTILESEKREKLKLQTAELSKRLARVNDAITKIVQILKLDYTTANTVLRDCVLKGLMPELAKVLEIEDLVNKQVPEKLN